MFMVSTSVRAIRFRLSERRLVSPQTLRRTFRIFVQVMMEEKRMVATGAKKPKVRMKFRYPVLAKGECQSGEHLEKYRNNLTSFVLQK